MTKRLCVIPAEAVFDQQLRNMDLRTLCALAAFADRDGKCWPATTTLAEKLGVSDRHVRICLRNLEACGYLRTKHRPGQRSIYFIMRKPPDPGSIGSGVDNPGTIGSGVTDDPGTIGSAPPEPGGPPKDTRNNTNNNYAFDGKLIRLTEEGLDAWAKAYHRLDLRAELQALDDYYDRELTGKDRRNWYQRCSQALNNKNRRARAERQVENGEADSDTIY